MRSNLKDIEVWLHRTTYPDDDDKGAYFVSVDHVEKVWIPKSLCEIEIKDVRTGRAILTASESLLTEKGLL